MKKIIITLVFLFIASYAMADAPVSWRGYMSPAHAQPDTSQRCPTYAAIHCMEGLYNYYYELNNFLEISEDQYLFQGEPLWFMGDVFDDIKEQRVISINENAYPNLSHSYFSIAGHDDIPSTATDGYSNNNRLENLLEHLTNWGPVGLQIKGYSNIKFYVENQYDPESVYPQFRVPATLTTGGTGGDFHCVAVVDSGFYNDQLYLECFNSYHTEDDHFFKIFTDIQNFEVWAGEVVAARLHERDTLNLEYDRISETDPNIEFFFAPKIYPYLNKKLVAYDPYTYLETGGYPLQFFAEDEEIYILADTKVDGQTCNIWGNDDPEKDWPDKVTINIAGQLLDPMGGYHSYYNDIIIEDELVLDECTIKPYGAGNQSGPIYIPDGGDLTITGNVTIQDLPVGIYTKSNKLSISGENNKITGCGHGIIADQTGTSPADTVNGALIEEIGGTGIRVLGATGDLSCEDVGIYSSDHGVYLGAGADIELDFCTIGVDSLSFDISYDRLIQGGYGSNFTINNCNITYDDENYYALDNYYEEVYVDGNFWGTDVQSEIYDVFSCYGLVLNWNGRASHEVENNAPLPSKIAAPSPFDMARYYESIEDWRSAKDAYLQSIARSDDTMLNKRALKGLLHIYKEQEWPADDLRIITRNEYGKAENKQKPVFDFLYNETFVTEGDYFTAIEQFEDCAEKYAGTSVEVMMLSRIANIYGDYLDDPETAKQYADRAAALNPGQPILMSAYMSAGMLYEPSEYPDKFYHVLEYYDITDDPDSEPVAGDDITATPNPFNPSTTIRYTLNQSSRVELSIYSLTGQKIKTLVNTHQEAGSHAVTFDGGNLASGIYFYRFETAEAVKTGKLLMMK